MIQSDRKIRLLASLLTLSTVGCSTVMRPAIPDRPEKLTFPPLVYDPPAPADYRVQLAAGPIAYLVPDRSRPLITMQVLIRAPGYAVPAGKEPLNSLLADLLIQGGTTSRTAEQLEERLDFLAAELDVRASNTDMTARLNMLTKDFDEGLVILREVLTAPRFQEDRLALLKQQQLQSMRERNDASASIEQRERNFLAFGESFFANRHATAASLESITRDDLIGFHRRFFHPANMVFAVSGDFNRSEMVRKLDVFLKDWPISGQAAPACPADVAFAAPGIYLVNKPEVNQGRVGVLLPGIRRDNPDYYAVAVMNDILGGGGFTSRIMKRVRSDEGLAYSAGSHFPGGVYYPLFFSAGFQTKGRTVAFATSIVLTEMKRMAAEPVSDQELFTSKRSFIDVFPNHFATADQIAGTFADDEFTGRYASDPDYWKNYRARIDAVTQADVQRAAGKYLVPEKVVILVVGPKEDILKGHPDHPMSLQSLSAGPLKDVPLRDPLTMKPMAK